MNNEEKILQMLEKQWLILEQINKAQPQQGVTQAEQGVALKGLDKELTEVRRFTSRTAAQAEEMEQLSQCTAVPLETEYRDKLHSCLTAIPRPRKSWTACPLKIGPMNWSMRSASCVL